MLLVEDDSLTAKATSQALENLGYSCQWLASGSKVLEAVCSSEFDVIMPRFVDTRGTRRLLREPIECRDRLTIMLVRRYLTEHEDHGILEGTNRIACRASRAGRHRGGGGVHSGTH